MGFELGSDVSGDVPGAEGVLRHGAGGAAGAGAGVCVGAGDCVGAGVGWIVIGMSSMLFIGIGVASIGVGVASLLNELRYKTH